MQPKTIAEELFFSTVRIDTVMANGESGAGTGFFFGYNFGCDKKALFVVTNKHVVMGIREGSFSFLKQKDGFPALGDGFTVNIGPQDWTNMWFGHPDPNIDITIFPMWPLLEFAKKQHGTDLFFRTVGKDLIPTAEQMAELDAVESVTFIGYPNVIAHLPGAQAGRVRANVPARRWRMDCSAVWPCSLAVPVTER